MPAGSAAPLHRKARSSPFCSAKMRLKASSDRVIEARLTPGRAKSGSRPGPRSAERDPRRPQQAPHRGEDDRPEDRAQDGHRVEGEAQVEPRQRVLDQRVGLREQDEEDGAAEHRQDQDEQAAAEPGPRRGGAWRGGR